MFKAVAAVFLPPLGVYLQSGLKKQFWINLVLTSLGIVPGIIHAVWNLSLKT